MSDLIDRDAALQAIKCSELGMEYDAIEALPVIAAPRWVRCEEELPRKTRKFVVWVPVNNGPYPCWYEERTALWQAVEKKWYVDHNPKTWWVGEPTHWIPIEPPREDENADK